MAISLSFTHVTVSDVDESLGFYRDSLGLVVHNDVSDPAGRWVTVGSDERPGVDLVLSEPHAGRSRADGDAVHERLLAPGSNTVRITARPVTA